MKENLISIIIPIRDTRDYLEKCLDSVIHQTYSNLEIILVNDLDTEGTKEICEKYSSLDNRIKIINISSVEVGEARNIGIKQATGEYLGFVDSDDYIAEDMYEILLNTLRDNNADIADIGFAREENGEIEAKVFTGKIEVFDKESALEEILKDKKILSFMWNKLFKRKVWNNIWFDSQKVFEDIDIMYKLFENAEKVVSIDILKYIYVQRSTSIMHTPNSLFMLDRLNVVVDRYNHFKNKYNDKIQFMNKYAFAVNIIVIYRKIVLNHFDDIYNDFMKHYDLFLKVINEYETEIRKILTPNQNLVLDFMLTDLSTAPEKIRNVKDIDK